MPRLLDGNGILPLAHYATGMLAAGGILALLILWFRGEVSTRSLADGCDFRCGSKIVEHSFASDGPFHCWLLRESHVPLAVSKVVLIVLLSETVMLHAKLSIANKQTSART